MGYFQQVHKLGQTLAMSVMVLALSINFLWSIFTLRKLQRV